MTTADDKTDSAEQHAAVPGFSPEALNVFPELHDAPEPVHQWPLGGYQVAMHRGRDAFWAVIRRPERGGIALRTFPIMGAYDLETVSTNDRGGEWKVSTHSGCYNIVVQATDDGVLRITSRLTPSHDLLVVFWPRDLYVLDPHDDPRPARGQVEAGQRGLNGGFCYFTLEEPDFGNVLYMQNFSAMNDFFNDTKTKPDGVVGGQWPELGYQPPGSPMAFTPPLDPLKKGKTYVISDALVRIHGDARIDEFESA
ncbi:MAG: hypothetical protein JF615_10930, partial [Asticcacaulis sp.]|nr:hypothetical protein [Asticcacaulis sp.]